MFEYELLAGFVGVSLELVDLLVFVVELDIVDFEDIVDIADFVELAVIVVGDGVLVVFFFSDSLCCNIC